MKAIVCALLVGAVVMPVSVSAKGVREKLHQTAHRRFPAVVAPPPAGRILQPRDPAASPSAGRIAAFWLKVHAGSAAVFGGSAFLWSFVHQQQSVENAARVGLQWAGRGLLAPAAGVAVLAVGLAGVLAWDAAPWNNRPNY